MLMAQTEFAEMLGVCFSAVNRWETGKHSPTMKTKRKSLEKHHLFPKTFLKSKNYTDNQINQMAKLCVY